MLTDFHANGSYEDIAKHFKLLDNKDYAYMVRTTDLECENYENDVKYVSRSCYEYLSKSKVYGGEVLINKIGSPGLTYLMPHLNKPVSLGMNLFMLKMKQDSAIDNVTLYLYLNSKIGKSLITRDINGTVPLTIDKESVKSILVPVFTHDFKSYLSQILNKREETFKLSNCYYTQAEEILNKELNITKIENTKTYSVRSFSTSYGKSKRLDAEYYDEKYDSLLNSLNSYDGNLKTLNDISTYVFTGEYADNYIKTKSKDNVYYIRGTNINKGYIEVDDDYCVNKEIFSKLLSSNDILTGRVGTIGNFGVVDEKLTNCVCSDNVLCFHLPSEYDPNVYALYLNSNCVKQLTKRMSRGSVQQRFNQETMKELPIPFISDDIQSQISQKVQESFKLRKQSKELLEKAVKAVEIAIEKGEEYATKWLKEKTNEYFMK